MRGFQNGNAIGRVVGLWRYPVKSMAAESLEATSVSWHGVAGDRRWAFVRNEATQSGFPWLTLRERSDLNHYLPSFVDPSQPDKSATHVRAPSGRVFTITDPELAAELYPAGARAIKQDRGVFDTFPLSLITTQTIEELSRRVGKPLSVARFRPNILVDACEAMPFVEDEWVGCTLRVGDTRMRIDKRDSRCAVITIDPVTTERAPEILRTVARDREGCLGIYGTTVEPGRISIGDEVFIESTL